MNLISMDPKRVRSVISDGNADFSGYTMLHAMLENIMNIGPTKKGMPFFGEPKYRIGLFVCESRHQTRQQFPFSVVESLVG